MAGNRDIDLPTIALNREIRIELRQIAEAGQRQIAQIDLVDIHLIDVGIPGGEHAGSVFWG